MRWKRVEFWVPIPNLKFSSWTNPTRRRLRFRLCTLFVVMLICCAVFAAWGANRRSYTAESVLRVRRTGSGTIQDYWTFKETQATLLKSSAVLSAAAKNPKVAEILANMSDPIGVLDDLVQVDLVGEAELVRVRLHGGADNETLCILLDGVVEAYLKHISEDEAEGGRREKLVQVVQEATVPGP